VKNASQAPEAAEVRAQEGVRTRDDEAREGRSPGDQPIQEAMEKAAEVAEKTGGLGEPGRPINRRSPFMIGMMAAFGVAVAYGLIEVVIRARSGIVGALVAIPVAAAIRLLLQEIAFHRLDIS
jgi:hypothetical protein